VEKNRGCQSVKGQTNSGLGAVVTKQRDRWGGGATTAFEKKRRQEGGKGTNLRVERKKTDYELRGLDEKKRKMKRKKK